MTVQIRPAATHAERLDALAVRHRGRAMPLAAYQANRLACPREHRATAWVVVDGGRVVSTLVVHPLTFALDDATFAGYGIGSVATLATHRRRGHASALCAAACGSAEQSGRRVGLLFSAIPPAFYERLGFAVSPASGQRCDRLRDLVADGAAADLVPVDPRAEAERLAETWRAFHGGTLHVARDAAALVRSADLGAGETWFAVGGDLRRGYVRLGRNEDTGTLELLEPVVLDAADESPVLRAVARMALDLGLPAVTGWMPPSEAVRAWCVETSRAETLSMLRGAPPHAAARFWGSDHF